MKKIAYIASFLSLAPILLVIGLAGCSTWERTTFQTLNTAQQTLNAAQAAYEVSATGPCPATGPTCLPHTATVDTIITKAKAADVLAVNAMVTYEEAKAANVGVTGLAAAENDVNVAVGNLSTLIGDVKALGGSN